MLSLFFMIYSLLQLICFKALSILVKFLKNEAGARFVHLRSPNRFLNALDKAALNHKKNAFANGKPSPLFWIHVSSAGELEQAIPVARRLHEELDACFFVTYYSASTEPFLKNFPATLAATPLPLDLPSLYKKAFEKLPIRHLFFVRYDIWPGLFMCAQEKKIPINLLCATHTPTKKGYAGRISACWHGLFYPRFSHIFAVSKQDFSYFKDHFPNAPVSLAGDPKWMRAWERAQMLQKTKEDPFFAKLIAHFQLQKPYKKILVVGSPHDTEEQVIAWLGRHIGDLLIILAPHYVDAVSIQNLQKKLFSGSPCSYNAAFYSEHEAANTLPAASVNLFIVDKIGFLSEVYQVADAALIGGGFDGQIHNVLEAAAHKVPVLYGNNYTRAREAAQLVEAQAALSFETPQALFHFLCSWGNVDAPMSLAKFLPDTLLPADALLQKAHQNAAQLFQDIPNTSAVILAAIKRNLYDDNKQTTDHQLHIV